MKKMSYEEAFARLEAIVGELENPDVNLNQVEGFMKEAVSLMEFCKGELKGYEKSFASILENK